MSSVGREGRMFLNFRALSGSGDNPEGWGLGMASPGLGFREVILVSVGDWAEEESRAKQVDCKVIRVMYSREVKCLDCPRGLAGRDQRKVEDLVVGQGRDGMV